MLGNIQIDVNRNETSRIRYDFEDEIEGVDLDTGEKKIRSIQPPGCYMSSTRLASEKPAVIFSSDTLLQLKSLPTRSNKRLRSSKNLLLFVSLEFKFNSAPIDGVYNCITTFVARQVQGGTSPGCKLDINPSTA